MTPLTLKIEMDGLRHSVIHAMQTKHTELEQAVDESLKKMVDTFDFASFVQQVSEQALRDAIVRTIGNLERNGEFQEAVTGAVCKGIETAFERGFPFK